MRRAADEKAERPPGTAPVVPMGELQELERLVARLRNELQAVREERDELLKTLRSWLRAAKKNMDLDA
jgi:hypothetical protein